MNFSIEGRNIRYGLSSIKGISEKSKERLKDFIDKKPTNKLEVFQAAKEAPKQSSNTVIAPSTNVNNTNNAVASYYGPRNTDTTATDYVRRRAVG
jgi:hypothetical protein